MWPWYQMILPPLPPRCSVITTHSWGILATSQEPTTMVGTRRVRTCRWGSEPTVLHSCSCGEEDWESSSLLGCL
ncbi:hypothetical protein EYF80_051797 [Liparis tanakae]|uniref:Uncharacterized protein n=1 Tax=Liparis tanakae TaxID=230148 RepID=A0A4Z2FA08_9TELE|nr:hypothetical protein EYF80_051797 [Liparis tanakae]